SAHVDLDLTAGFGNGQDPSNALATVLRTEFRLDWVFNTTTAPSGNLQNVGFGNIQLNVGALTGGIVGGVLRDIQKVLAPIKPIIDVLTTPIPVISDLAGEVTLIKLAKLFGYVSADTETFVAQAKKLIDFVFSIPTSGGDAWIPLGSFDVAGGNGNGQGVPLQIGGFGGSIQYSNPHPASSQQIHDALLTPGSKDAGAFLDSTGFSFPILQDPTQVFNLLLGKDVDIVKYAMPKMSLAFTYTQFFRIFGPLGARLTGSIGASAQFTFAFDTHGIREFAEGGFKDPGKVADRFYVVTPADP
ncbi:hypothetical protein ACYOEI_39755, partial [Singulisphaera rosea]